MDRRQSPRKQLDPIHIAEMKTTDRMTVLAHDGTILNASATGLLIRVDRKALSSEVFQQDVPLTAIEGEHVVMQIVEMALEIDGRIVRARHATPAWCEIAIDFTDNAPAYWRECLAELLPGLGEMVQAAAAEAVEAQGNQGRPVLEMD
ncbi:MAG TPA: hypothetical protein VIH59_21795 [Candidatus Tectomicrobia bacterium]|jgi:hypothetical protein